MAGVDGAWEEDAVHGVDDTAARWSEERSLLEELAKAGKVSGEFLAAALATRSNTFRVDCAEVRGIVDCFAFSTRPLEIPE
jgi:hypothetical protein